MSECDDKALEGCADSLLNNQSNVVIIILNIWLVIKLTYQGSILEEDRLYNLIGIA